MFGKKKRTESKEKPIKQSEMNAFDWEDNHINFLERSERRAWYVAFILGGAFMFAIIGIILMLPLKSTVPYVMRVDKTTGAVDLVTSIRGESIEFDEVSDRYWVSNYVRHREAYDWSFIANDYLATKEFSAENVFKPYHELYTSEKSPEKIYGSDKSIRVNIISVTINHEQQTAVVRFNKTLSSRKEGNVLGITNWVATVRYEYAPKTLKTTEMRDINPFGFTVTGYQIAPEADQIPMSTTSSTAKPAEPAPEQPAAPAPTPAPNLEPLPAPAPATPAPAPATPEIIPLPASENN